jgi:5-methylcytosine-specific restriction protein B
MSKLNRIFYGPAGTGKTREAIKQAVEIVKKSNNNEYLDSFNLSKNKIVNYNEIIKFFNEVSNLPELNITNIKLLKEINNLKISIDKIIKDKDYTGHLQSLEDPKKEISKYRSYPLIETVTFHPSYSYQDFVEGITVETNNKNNIEYKIKDGIFKKICKRAIDNENYNYVLIIDEINRGDISSIFGEIFTLIEDKKRLGENEEMTINLPYSKDEKGNPEKLKVPKNLYILATMNTVDKSIALIDIALRRRFEFIECMPDYTLPELQKEIKNVKLSNLLKSINDRITVLKNEHYQIGHSYFLDINSIEELIEVFKTKVIPLLQEYFYDDWKSICAVLNQSYNNPNSDKGILIPSNINKKIFNDEFEDLVEFRNKKIFKINPNIKIEDLISIYK